MLLLTAAALLLVVFSGINDHRAGASYFYSIYRGIDGILQRGEH
jgi:hypothetical protein